MSWPNTAHLHRAQSIILGLARNAPVGGSSSLRIRTGSSNGQRTRRGEDSRISPPLGCYFTLLVFCCRSTISCPPLSKRPQGFSIDAKSVEQRPDQRSCRAWASRHRFSEYPISFPGNCGESPTPFLGPDDTHSFAAEEIPRLLCKTNH